MSIKQKIQRTALGGLAALAFSGCETTPQMQGLFNSAATTAIHTTVVQGIKGELNPDASNVNVNVNNGGGQGNLPENVIYRDGKYQPVEGYGWVNPSDHSDLRVRIKPIRYWISNFVDRNGDGIEQKTEATRKYEVGDKVIIVMTPYNVPDNQYVELEVMNGEELRLHLESKTDRRLKGFRKYMEVEEKDRGKYFEIKWKVGNSPWLNDSFIVK
jgi:hypothetical protein